MTNPTPPDPLAPPTSGAPPTYEPTLPQILVAPLPDTATFFHGKTIQGEVFVKGLGEKKGSRGVKRLSVNLHVTNHLPSKPTVELFNSSVCELYPTNNHHNAWTNPPSAAIPSGSQHPHQVGPTDPALASSSTPDQKSHGSQSTIINTSTSLPLSTARDPPFPSQHRFTIPLSQGVSSSSEGTSATGGSVASPTLPGTLNLSASDRGEIRWTLIVRLELNTGVFEEEVRIEGTPQEVASDSSRDEDGQDADRPQRSEGNTSSRISHNHRDAKREVEQKLEKSGVRTRLVLDCDQPRLGDLLRLGVEVCPIVSEKSKAGEEGSSAQPNPAETLRPLRRVRVEFFRKVEIRSGGEISDQDQDRDQEQDRDQAVNASSSSSSGTSTTTTTTTTITNSDIPSRQHLSLLYTSGKSLRFPGTARAHPPLRVLFTLPTTYLGIIADQTWGETSSSVPYHRVSFFVRVTIGFGSPGESAHAASGTTGGMTGSIGSAVASAMAKVAGTASSSASASASTSGAKSGSGKRAEGSGLGDWYLEKEVTIRPKLWVEQRPPGPSGFPGRLRGPESEGSEGQVAGAHGAPEGDSDMAIAMASASDGWEDLSEEAAREAYRLKGRDVVGDTGTYRADQPSGDDLPPPFEMDGGGGGGWGGAGPSTAQAHTGETFATAPPDQASQSTLNPTVESTRPEEEGMASTPNELPTFLESEAQMRAGDVPFPLPAGSNGRDASPSGYTGERSTSVGRRGSLGGELGTWIEYDGYETFSLAPPSAAASFGVGGSMDPPQEGDEDINVIGGMVARLGLGMAEPGRGVRPGGQVELMEQLGLGEGTRVVDLQDDLPPGIDEPSLPALPPFDPSRYSPPQLQHPHLSHSHPHLLDLDDSSQPSSTGSQSPDLHLALNLDLDRNLGLGLGPNANLTLNRNLDLGNVTEQEHPPSFAASEAAQALGSTARSVVIPLGVPSQPTTIQVLRARGGGALSSRTSGNTSSTSLSRIHNVNEFDQQTPPEFAIVDPQLQSQSQSQSQAQSRSQSQSRSRSSLHGHATEVRSVNASRSGSGDLLLDAALGREHQHQHQHADAPPGYFGDDISHPLPPPPPSGRIHPHRGQPGRMLGDDRGTEPQEEEAMGPGGLPPYTH